MGHLTTLDFYILIVDCRMHVLHYSLTWNQLVYYESDFNVFFSLYCFNRIRLIGHLQGASSCCINALFLLDNIMPVLDTINGFQLSVVNSRNNDFLYCILIGLYMAN